MLQDQEEQLIKNGRSVYPNNWIHLTWLCWLEWISGVYQKRGVAESLIQKIWSAWR